jgi:hypothetical protein
MKLNSSVDPGSLSDVVAESLAESIEPLWRCRTLARKGRFLQSHFEVDATPGIGWLLARAAWLVFDESRSGRVPSVGSTQTEVG